MTAERFQPFSIGPVEISNPLLLSPLSGISDLPFRLLAKEQGCALVCTEMVSAEGLIRNRKSADRSLQSCREERPLAVQIFGSRPESMAEAAKIIEGWGADILDINMGCPVRKVVRGGAGAALLKDMKLARKIIQSVRQAISIPLTIKIRCGWDGKNLNFLEMGQMAQDERVDAIIVHGRTRTQGYGTRADWEAISRVKERLQIPVIGNGDLLSPEKVGRFLSQSGCPGAMIGRGALGNPWIFRQSLDLLRGQSPNEPSLQEKEATVLRHLEMIVKRRGEDYGLKEFRKHLIWYTRGLKGAPEFRVKIPMWKTLSAVRGSIQAFFQNIREVSLS